MKCPILLNQPHDSSHTAQKSEVSFVISCTIRKLPFFTKFSLESKRAQASISLKFKPILASCVILAHGIVTAGVMKDKVEKGQCDEKPCRIVRTKNKRADGRLNEKFAKFSWFLEICHPPSSPDSIKQHQFSDHHHTPDDWRHLVHRSFEHNLFNNLLPLTFNSHV